VAVAAAARARAVARSIARVVISATEDTFGMGRRRRRKVLRVGQLAVGAYLSSVLSRVWRLRQRLRLDRQCLPRTTPRDGLVHQPSLFGRPGCAAGTAAVNRAAAAARAHRLRL
jgi:hypothetical protein